MPYLSQNKNGQAILSLYVQPKAARNRFCGLHGEEVKLAITAPPVEGKANKAVAAFVAKFFKVPKSAVVVIAGQQSRHKRLLVEGLDCQQVRDRLAAVLD